MRKAGCHPVGSAVRTTWEGRTMWIITRGRRRGSVLRRTTMLENSVLNWNSRPMRSAPGIRTVCCRRIALEQIRLHYPTGCRPHLLHILLPQHLELPPPPQDPPRPTMPVQLRWSRPVLLPPVQANFRLAGSSVTHQKDVPISWTTTRARLPGLIRGGSST